MSRRADRALHLWLYLSEPRTAAEVRAELGLSTSRARELAAQLEAAGVVRRVGGTITRSGSDRDALVALRRAR